jgi:hypothetical protein
MTRNHLSGPREVHTRGIGKLLLTTSIAFEQRSKPPPQCRQSNCSKGLHLGHSLPIRMHFREQWSMQAPGAGAAIRAKANL